MKTVITFDTFDISHIGYLNILRRASEIGDRLVVGISSDLLIKSLFYQALSGNR